MIPKTVHIASTLGRNMTKYEYERVARYVHDIRDRLKEVYGETLPEKLDREIDYIVKETYLVSRNDIVTYDLTV